MGVGGWVGGGWGLLLRAKIVHDVVVGDILVCSVLSFFLSFFFFFFFKSDFLKNSGIPVNACFSGI